MQSCIADLRATALTRACRPPPPPPPTHCPFSCPLPRSARRCWSRSPGRRIGWTRTSGARGLVLLVRLVLEPCRHKGVYTRLLPPRVHAASAQPRWSNCGCSMRWRRQSARVGEPVGARIAGRGGGGQGGGAHCQMQAAGARERALALPCCAALHRAQCARLTTSWTTWRFSALRRSARATTPCGASTVCGARCCPGTARPQHADASQSLVASHRLACPPHRDEVAQLRTNLHAAREEALRLGVAAEKRATLGAQSPPPAPTPPRRGDHRLCLSHPCSPHPHRDPAGGAAQPGR